MSNGSSPLGLLTGTEAENANSIGSYEIGKILEDKTLLKSLFQNNSFPSNHTPISTTSNNTNSIEDLDSTFNTSIPQLVKYTNNYPSMRLLNADFVYLRDLGVFPNNRLMIARRFASAVPDDLTTITATPLSTLISWVPDGDNFIDINFGEKWTDSEASFKDVLNEIGKDSLATGIGDILSSGANVIPLPGFMEGLQYKVMEKLGIVDDGDEIPAGNPNLIREAKIRETVKDGVSGSGLKCDISITMKVVYEQKFISGIDPTLVYFDIVANILSFGTSDSYFQFNAKLNNAVGNIIGDLISGDIKRVLSALGEFITKLTAAVTEVAIELAKSMTNAASKMFDKKTAADAKEKDGGKPSEIGYTDIANAFFKPLLGDTLGKVIKKYKIRLIGIANALTGTPSAPWHVTIGNPKRPLFTSGDMLVGDVKLSMGPLLSYNDLPSTITAEMTFTNARSLGGNEIFRKFNSGKGRTSKRINMSLVEFKHSNDMTKTVTYTDTQRVNPNLTVERNDTREQLSPISDMQTSGLVNVEGANLPKSGILTSPDIITEVPLDIPLVPKPEVPSLYNWSVTLNDTNSPIEFASGTAKTKEEANRLIELFATGGTIKERNIEKVT